MTKFPCSCKLTYTENSREIHPDHLVKWPSDTANGTLCQFIEVKISKNNAQFSLAIDLAVDHKLHTKLSLFPIARQDHCIIV